jgi:hypothetical protein
MNPGSSYLHTLGLRATKAWAPQALSFRGFLFSSDRQGLGQRRGSHGQKDFPKPVIVCNLHLALCISKEYNATKLQNNPATSGPQGLRKPLNGLIGEREMRASRIRFWLLMLCSGWLAAGWLNPAMAAADKEKPEPQPIAVKEDVQPGGRGEGFQPECAKEECPTTFGPIVTDTAIPVDKGKFVIQPTFGLSFTTHNFSPNWQRTSPGGNFKSFGMAWKFTYGLWNNLEVYAVIPYIHNWANNVQEPGPQGERSADFGGLGNINLTFKYRLVEETEAAPTVSAIFSPTFPTGHFRRLNPGRLGTDQLGGGSYNFTTGLNASKFLSPFIVYGNLWYTMGTAYTSNEDRSSLVRDENGDLMEGDPSSTRVRNYPRDFVTVNLAAEYPITKQWIALLELTSTWDGGRLIGHKANVAPTPLLNLVPLSIVPGIEYMATDKFSLALGVKIDLAGKNSPANIAPLLSMAYAF